MKAKKKSANGTVKMTDFIEKVSEVNETKQHDLFCFVKGNRGVNQSHVNKLIAKIKRKNLREIPIYVGPMNKDGKYPILDGQHRFEAYKTLDLPIRFIIVDYMTINDVPSMNSTKLSWGNKDYLQRYVDKDMPSYIYYKKFMETYTLDNKFSVVTTILNGVYKRERGLEVDFVDGRFDISDTGKQNAEKIGVFLGNVFDVLGKEVKNSFFIFALLHAISHKNFNKEHFVGKLKKRSKMFSGCVNTLQWYDVIKKVYKLRNQKYKVEFTPIKEDKYCGALGPLRKEI